MSITERHEYPTNAIADLSLAISAGESSESVQMNIALIKKMHGCKTDEAIVSYVKQLRSTKAESLELGHVRNEQEWLASLSRLQMNLVQRVLASKRKVSSVDGVSTDTDRSIEGNDNEPAAGANVDEPQSAGVLDDSVLAGSHESNDKLTVSGAIEPLPEEADSYSAAGNYRTDNSGALPEFGNEGASSSVPQRNGEHTIAPELAVNHHEKPSEEPEELRETPDIYFSKEEDSSDHENVRNSRNTTSESIRGFEAVPVERIVNREETEVAPPAAGPGHRFARPEVPSSPPPEAEAGQALYVSNEPEKIVSQTVASGPDDAASKRKSSNSWLEIARAPDTKSVRPGQPREEIEEFVRRWCKFYNKPVDIAIGQYCRNLYLTRPDNQDPEEEMRLRLNWQQSLSDFQVTLLGEARRARRRKEYREEKMKYEGRSVRSYFRPPIIALNQAEQCANQNNTSNLLEAHDDRLARQKRESAKRRYGADPEKKRQQSRDRMRAKRERDRIANQKGDL